MAILSGNFPCWKVAASEDYSFSADVHSFAMLLWQICTLQKPFGDLNSVESITTMVMHKDMHPPVHRISSICVQALLSESWHREPSARPSFDNLVPRLEGEVKRVVESRRVGLRRCHSIQVPRKVFLGTSQRRRPLAKIDRELSVSFP